jgi:hypothetical protein
LSELFLPGKRDTGRGIGFDRCSVSTLSGKDSAVWISPTATMSWPQPSRSAVTPRAETAG